MIPRGLKSVRTGVIKTAIAPNRICKVVKQRETFTVAKHLVFSSGSQ